MQYFSEENKVKCQTSKNQGSNGKPLKARSFTAQNHKSKLNAADALYCIMDFGCPSVNLPWPVNTYHVRFYPLLHPVILSVLFVSAPTRQIYYRKTTFRSFAVFITKPLKSWGYMGISCMSRKGEEFCRGTMSAKSVVVVFKEI